MGTRTGRRAGNSEAREDILVAARELFARTGFAATSLRAIASRADVDVALIPYYFTNKRGLFVAAMELPIDPGSLVRKAADGSREELGGRIARTFLTAWDDPVNGAGLQAFLRSAASDDPTAATFGEFLSHEMLPLVAQEFGLPRDTVRVVGSTLFGLAFLRYVCGAPAFTEQSAVDLAELYGPRLQAIIDAGTAEPIDVGDNEPSGVGDNEPSGVGGD